MTCIDALMKRHDLEIICDNRQHILLSNSAWEGFMNYSTVAVEWGKAAAVMGIMGAPPPPLISFPDCLSFLGGTECFPFACFFLTIICN